MNPAQLRQLRFSRVKSAYQNCKQFWTELLLKNDFVLDNFELIFLILKKERKLQVYCAYPQHDFKLITEFAILGLSGNLGPKRREGDLQTPEGFYEITHYNPESNFHLSMKINYPNLADNILSDANYPGTEIYIHGQEQSTGCFALGNESIEKLYVLSILSKNYQEINPIPVYIFPCQFNKKQDFTNTQYTDLWQNLSEGYYLFKEKRRALRFSVNKSGTYIFE